MAMHSVYVTCLQVMEEDLESDEQVEAMDTDALIIEVRVYLAIPAYSMTLLCHAMMQCVCWVQKEADDAACSIVAQAVQDAVAEEAACRIVTQAVQFALAEEAAHSIVTQAVQYAVAEEVGNDCPGGFTACVVSSRSCLCLCRLQLLQGVLQKEAKARRYVMH